MTRIGAVMVTAAFAHGDEGCGWQGHGGKVVHHRNGHGGKVVESRPDHGGSVDCD